MADATNTERMILAIGRIEHAVSRIERRPAAPAGDPALAARHAELRETVADAIGRIDALLDPAGTGAAG